MQIDPTMLYALGALYLIAVADVCFSRLSVGAKVLWAFTLLFLVGVGLVAWLITRHTAHQWVGISPSTDASVGGDSLT